MKAAALAAMLAIVPATVWAKPLPLYGKFAYSDLCWEKETGDAAGSRFELIRTTRGARLVYEYGNGPLVSARIRSFRTEGGKFDADASSTDGDFTLSATFGTRRATLLRVFDFQKDHPPEKDVMKRIKRFDQKIPACHG